MGQGEGSVSKVLSNKRENLSLDAQHPHSQGWLCLL